MVCRCAARLLDVVRRDLAIITARRQLRAITVEGHAPHLVPVLVGCHEARALRDVPELDAAVTGPRGKVHVVGVSGHGEDPGLMAGKGLDEVAVCLVEVDVHVIACREQQL